MKKLRLIATILLLAAALPAAAQNSPSKKELKVLNDTLTARTRRHFGGYWKVDTKEVKAMGPVLDFKFTDDIIYWPWHETDVIWFRRELDKELAKLSQNYIAGTLAVRDLELEDLITPPIGSRGRPSPDYKYRQGDPRLSSANRFINRVGARRYKKGMSDRYIALWQSHGRYFDVKDSLWRWQRATLHRTVEDMYTQSYVIPFLIPMLENAGAYVMTPRERDIQRLEVVCDNDPMFDGPREAELRQIGKYSEIGDWEDGGTGFADALRTYSSTLNPFRMGTVRKTECSSDNAATAYARWTPDFAKRGRYAVYISYSSLPQSNTLAHYTVRHMGGDTEFYVNQRRGGGTWIYLGTFEFAEGSDSYVELDNVGTKGTVVTADGVRFGGGMGKVARGGEMSGLPAFAEGALYSMIWAGADSSLYVEWPSDYTRDFASRGNWTRWMKGAKSIPFDMSFALHSDAGTTPNDSIVGTLSIYTLKSEDKREFANGKDRMSCRMLAEYVQSQVVDDIRKDFEPRWSRRMLWDKSYSESRTTDVPAMLLELLSHQNFADMKYGLDPDFRFTVSRAIYKGMLKFLSELYGCQYVVQPLPVNEFSVRLAGGKAILGWQATEDKKEATAVPSGYIVYTRVDDGAFDQGMEVESCSAEIPVKPGHIYSFKVEAWNEGGRSFPSEILAVGTPDGSDPQVLIVNNFDRISGPTWAESPGYAGFLGRLDSGVPYLYDISYIGENYEFRRSLRWDSDASPGCGASYTDQAGKIVAGNTFDYPYVHGKALMSQGFAFESCSHKAFENGTTSDSATILDLICGKQVTTMTGTGRKAARFEVFPAALQSAIRIWTGLGRSVLISGSSIGTDAWTRIYPIPEEPSEGTRAFVQEVLGYKLSNTYGTGSGSFTGVRRVRFGTISFRTKPNPDVYCVECPDGLEPADDKGKVWARYTSSDIPAGVVYSTPTYSVVSLGVPIETISSGDEQAAVMKTCLQYLKPAK